MVSKIKRRSISIFSQEQVSQSGLSLGLRSERKVCRAGKVERVSGKLYISVGVGQFLA